MATRVRRVPPLSFPFTSELVIFHWTMMATFFSEKDALFKKNISMNIYVHYIFSKLTVIYMYGNLYHLGESFWVSAKVRPTFGPAVPTPPPQETKSQCCGSSFSPKNLRDPWGEKWYENHGFFCHQINWNHWNNSTILERFQSTGLIMSCDVLAIQPVWHIFWHQGIAVIFPSHQTIKRELDGTLTSKVFQKNPWSVTIDKHWMYDMLTCKLRTKWLKWRYISALKNWRKPKITVIREL